MGVSKGNKTILTLVGLIFEDFTVKHQTASQVVMIVIVSYNYSSK